MLLMGTLNVCSAVILGIETPLPAAKTEIMMAYQSLLPVGRPSDFPQALMDFSNAVCTPKRPGCGNCCLAASCIAMAKGFVEKLPTKPSKVEKPLRRAIVFVAINHRGEIFLHRRPEKGLLGGMFGFPEIGLSAKMIDFSLNSKMAPFLQNGNCLMSQLCMFLRTLP